MPSSVGASKSSADFGQWGKYAVFGARKVEAFAAEHASETGYYCYVQYLLDRQLREAVAYAHAHGVALKGDLPIGVCRTSVDAWQHPQLFHTDSQAGAPPDAFSRDAAAEYRRKRPRSAAPS